VNPLLLILNARDIPECMDSYRALTVPRAYLTGYTERQLVPVIAELVETSGYTHFVCVSDDVVVPQRAVDAVYGLFEEHDVVTGWCNVDVHDGRCTVVDAPLGGDGQNPTRDDYHWTHWTYAAHHPERAVRTWFGAMCLTGMTREMWRFFPFDVLGPTVGWASDYSLCWRLQQADVPIFAARDGDCLHVKERWDTPCIDPRKRLLVGEVEPRVTIIK
jgi:hypothetical protein